MTNVKTQQPINQVIRTTFEQGLVALRQRNFPLVMEISKQLQRIGSHVAEAHYLVNRVALETGQLDIAIKSGQRAITLDENKAEYWAFLSVTLVQMGLFNEAERSVNRAMALETNDAETLNAMSHVFVLLMQYDKAIGLQRKAVAVEPDIAMYRHVLAVSLLELGELDSAKREFEKAVELAPNDVKSWWMLSSITKAKSLELPDRLFDKLSRFEGYPMAKAYVGYAAGKFYEDIKSWDKAFSAFEKGAEAKRSTVHYNKIAGRETFNQIKAICDHSWLHDKVNTKADFNAQPVFIVGQPRTGTTLVDRIISAHTLVSSAGEPLQLIQSLRQLTKTASKEFLSAELIANAASIDGEQLASSYFAGVEKVRGTTPYFIDKLPMNFMLLGFIAKAFPNAKIIHVTRNPIDTCFAVYKQLFADLYPHSYDQVEMAEHFVDYSQLMEHWQAIMPNNIYNVAYEDIVEDHRREARRLIDFIGLEWQDACYEFERNASAVVTASAVQVRQKVHKRSVNRWKEYETQLQPTIQILQSAGIAFEDIVLQDEIVA